MTAAERKSVFIVEDNPAAGILLQGAFEEEGFSVEIIQTGQEALKAFEKAPPSAVLLDLRLPDLFGIDVLEKMKRMEPEIPVIILTGYGDIDTAVQAIKKGAYHYLSKPYRSAELLLLVKKALAESRRERELAILEQRLGQRLLTRYAPGRSPRIRAVLEQVEKVAPTDMTVILQGESGVGKEVLARVLHHKSRRRDGPFIALDCGTLPEGLVESELFGYERGAFTGAEKRKLGQFELAHGGTLFLDEIGNLAAAVQAKLLRVIQERAVQHLGGRRPIPVDVRLLAASNRELGSEARAGRFREDLYHRLNEFTISLPPLRERPEDIPELVDIFLEDARRSLRKPLGGVSPEAMRLLQQAPWPGNIRQLKNTVRAGALMAGEIIEARHLLPLLGENSPPGAPAPEPKPPPSLREAAQGAERERILAALGAAGNNKSKAARLLNIDRSVLYEKLRKLGIPLKS